MALQQLQNQVPSSSSDDKHFFAALKFATSSALSMVLYAAIELNLLQLIKDSGASLTASDLASLISTSNPQQAASQIDRMLRFLSAHSVVNCNTESLPDGDVRRFYSLTPIGNYFTAEDDGATLASTLMFIQDRVTIASWYHLTDAVRQGGGIPFKLAHGMNAFEYNAVDPNFNRVFNRAMHHTSTIIMNRIMEVYTGFDGIQTLVDVGGGTGSVLKTILSKYPTINAINFDLPHVIQDAPPQPGMEHVGGDMFVSVPKGDAIFMKWILHDWSDEHCKKLLKNCFEALPENGKVIIAEFILPRDPGSDMEGYAVSSQSDVVMLLYHLGGKERSEEEFEALAKSAGFKRLVKVCCAFYMWVMEFHK